MIKLNILVKNKLRAVSLDRTKQTPQNLSLLVQAQFDLILTSSLGRAKILKPKNLFKSSQTLYF